MAFNTGSIRIKLLRLFSYSHLGVTVESSMMLSPLESRIINSINVRNIPMNFLLPMKHEEEETGPDMGSVAI